MRDKIRAQEMKVHEQRFYQRGENPFHKTVDFYPLNTFNTINDRESEDPFIVDTEDYLWHKRMRSQS